MSLVRQLAEAVNLRDVGGLEVEDARRVASCQLYRSGIVAHLDPATRQAIEDQLGVTDVVDLRRHAESDIDPRARFPNARVHHLPLIPDGKSPISNPVDTYDSVGDWYFRQVGMGAESIRGVFELLGSAEGGVLVHCHAGKDRTGSVVAIVLASVGASADAIARDYALSGTIVGDAFLDALPPKYAESHPDSILRFMDRLDDEYGSIQGFVEAIGVDDDTMEAVRSRLVILGPE